MTSLETRRTFLQDALRLSALGMFSPTLSSLQGLAPPESRWQMRPSASTIDFRKLPLEQALQSIAGLGFEAVDIWSAFNQCPHLDDALNRLGPDGLRAVLARHGLKLLSFSVYVGGYPRYAELLGQCGGGIALRGSAGACPPGELSAHMKTFLETLKPELELCEKHNSYLAIENHGNSLLDTLDTIKSFVDLNRNPRLGLALAPYHLQASKVPVEEAIAAAGGQLLFFYAWQNGNELQQLPGHGPADFTPWLNALGKINYLGYVNPFMHNEPEPAMMTASLAKSRDYLKACYARAVAPETAPPVIVVRYFCTMLTARSV
jgi:sugar phosphate isomerase/epimerase